MTGNQRGHFVKTIQGPRGIPGPNGVPMARRRRRALIDINKLDAEARAKNAKLEEERLRLLQQDPKQAKILEEEAARLRAAEEEANQRASIPNSSDSLANARKTIEGIAAADRAGSRGAIEESGNLDPRDLEGFTPPKAPVKGHTPAAGKTPDPDGPEAATAKQEANPAKPARKRAVKTKTTTIQT